MPGFGDTAVIALIALLLFGPKKLPVLARQLGKLMAEFRRASNEFRSQMEEELRVAEQADRQKEVAALEAASANKISPPAATESASTESETAPHTPPPAPSFASAEESDRVMDPHTEFSANDPTRYPETSDVIDTHVSTHSEAAVAASTESSAPATPIATSGELSMMPPETGLPLARSNGAAISIGSAPAELSLSPTHASTHEVELEPETLHG